MLVGRAGIHVICNRLLVSDLCLLTRIVYVSVICVLSRSLFAVIAKAHCGGFDRVAAERCCDLAIFIPVSGIKTAPTCHRENQWLYTYSSRRGFAIPFPACTAGRWAPRGRRRIPP